jgi:hypothetical protein
MGGDANMSDMRQEDYEKRRRARILGMAIDQTIQGLKNVVTYSNHKLWEIDDQGLMDVQKWKAIQEHASTSLIDIINLEKKLAVMANIYATMIPTNKELEMYRANLGSQKE